MKLWRYVATIAVVTTVAGFGSSGDASARQMEYINCKIEAKKGTTIVDPYTDARCVFKPTWPVDCLHFVTVGTGGPPAYVTPAHDPGPTGDVVGYLPVWGQGPGWMHIPAVPLPTPSLNRLYFVNQNSDPLSVRFYGIGMRVGRMNCEDPFAPAAP